MSAMGHDWDNDADEVRIFMPIAAGVKAKDIVYKLVRSGGAL
jgi:hypothetical protein